MFLLLHIVSNTADIEKYLTYESAYDVMIESLANELNTSVNEIKSIVNINNCVVNDYRRNFGIGKYDAWLNNDDYDTWKIVDLDNIKLK